MKDIWVLTIKTSLPHTCESAAEMTTTCTAYDSFEKGRDALRAAVRGFAFSQNSMFDGDGHITLFQQYAEDGVDGEDVDDFLSRSMLLYIADHLRRVFSGEDTDFSLPLDTYSDKLIGVTIQDGALQMFGDGDGPCNGIDPVIHTNLFSMQEDKHYYLYLDDRFGQDDCTSELYVDLQKTTIQ